MKELLKLGTLHVAGCVVRSPRDFSFLRGELIQLICLRDIKQSEIVVLRTVLINNERFPAPSNVCSFCPGGVDLPQLCQAKGFVCEFCSNDKDIIFPFQLNKCQRCEGEPSLLAAGPGGPVASSSRRLSIPLSWRDWKISKPRRLARALSKDRREGEGGEGGSKRGVAQWIKSRMQEESGDTEGERRGAFAPVKLVKASIGSKSDEEEQETGGTDSEREEEMKREGGNGEEFSKERKKSKERGDDHANNNNANVLNVLHIDRMKKNVSTEDRRGSDSETCSMESLDDVGQERKGLRKVSGLASLAKGFSKREIEDECKTEVKEEESENRYLEKEAGSEEEGEGSREGDDKNDISGKGQREAAEREISGAENKEKFTLRKLLKPHWLFAVFSRGRSKGEEDRSGESDGKSEFEFEEERQQEPAVVTQTNWRDRKTRNARRETRGRKIRKGTEKESKTASGEIEEIHDADYCIEGDGGQE